jgi:hypothetical protein
MKWLVLFTYNQPNTNTEGLRIGVYEGKRDTEREPLNGKTVGSNYRLYDVLRGKFKRTRTLWYIRDYTGFKQYYRERMGFCVCIPFVGSLLRRNLVVNK